MDESANKVKEPIYVMTWQAMTHQKTNADSPDQLDQRWRRWRRKERERNRAWIRKPVRGAVPPLPRLKSFRILGSSLSGQARETKPKHHRKVRIRLEPESTGQQKSWKSLNRNNMNQKLNKILRRQAKIAESFKLHKKERERERESERLFWVFLIAC